MLKILFVCTGNTCRSPMAEHLLRAKAGDAYLIQSAGLSAHNGQDASEHVHHILGQKGVILKHEAQQVTPELMEWADLVLTMTVAHQEQLVHYFPQLQDKIIPFKRYVDELATDFDISDPFGGSLLRYEQTAAELEDLIAKFLEKQTKIKDET